MGNAQILALVRNMVLLGLMVGVVFQAEGICIKPWKGGTGHLLKQYVGHEEKDDGGMPPECGLPWLSP